MTSTRTGHLAAHAATDGDAPRRGLVVAIDGPGSSGKSSVGMTAAAELGYRFCDTGLLYRAIALLALRAGVALDDGPRVAELASHVELAADAVGRFSRVRVGGRDVTRSVRGASVDRRVSEVARQHAVRSALIPVQRTLAAGGGIVMVGRDIGTVVLPDADVKVYLDASAAERARRRAAERGIDPCGAEAAEILADLERRDTVDSTRAVAPLRPAADAVVVHTDGIPFDAVVARVVGLCRALTASRGGGGAVAGQGHGNGR